MAKVKRNWFRPALGEQVLLIFSGGIDWEATFREAGPADLGETFAAWIREYEHAGAW